MLSIDKSLGRSRKVCGYEIKRMPLGVFLAAMRHVEDTPKELLAAMWPDKSAAQLLAEIKTISPEGVLDIALRALSVAPALVTGLLSELLGVPEEKLLNDEQIGLNGIRKMLEAWLEVNEIEDFTRAARPLAARLKQLTTGSKR